MSMQLIDRDNVFDLLQKFQISIEDFVNNNDEDDSQELKEFYATSARVLLNSIVESIKELPYFEVDHNLQDGDGTSYET